eukprot:71445_1
MQRGSLKTLLLRPRNAILVCLLFVVCCWAGLVFWQQWSHMSDDSMSMRFMVYEVHGRVQGVFFRKHTNKAAKKFRIRGWVKNDPQNPNRIHGEAEGDHQSIVKFKRFLETEGSPSSRIDKAIFKDEREISEFTFDAFDVRH